MLRRLYTVFFYLLLPTIILRLFWRSQRTPAYRQRLSQRLGFCPWQLEQESIWLHAVSVGEVEAALPLAREIMNRYPRCPLIITTTTPTGSERIRNILGNEVLHSYLPYDLPACIERFLRRSQPKLAIIMETELWPNLFHHCQQQKTPVIIANARLSARSAKRYQRFTKLLAMMLSDIRLIACQTEQDAAHFRQLGASKAQLAVTGNIKFDRPLPDNLEQRAKELQQLWQQSPPRPCWLAASTHEGEEEVILHAFNLARQHLPELLLIIVPRHPERFSSVASLCQKRGFEVTRRSLYPPGEKQKNNFEILIGDSMGELLTFYAAADIAFIGGSLIARGGHNVIEPAAIGCPMIYGQHMFNFSAISQSLLEQGGAIEVHNAEELAQAVSSLLLDNQRAKIQAEQAQCLIKESQGALPKTLRLIAPLLQP